jgi:L-lactate dehydrogenase complex protein LldE
MAERVVLFPTCVVDTVRPGVGAAAVRVLRRHGFDVEVPRSATCCGQPAWNAGFAPQAAKVARTTLGALDASEGTICVPAGSCATMMRVFWPELFELAGDHGAAATARRVGGRVREFSELLGSQPRAAEESEPAVPPRTALREKKVAYHHSCHMLRELGIHNEPLDAVRSTGAEIVPWPGDDRCCGFGGLFSIKQPETSVAMADDKIDSLRTTGAEVLVGCDASCLMHLRGRMERRSEPMPVQHLAEFLDGE